MKKFVKVVRIVCFCSVVLMQSCVAARSANAHDFIVQQTLGYKTNVGEGGLQMSGGQKQVHMFSQSFAGVVSDFVLS